VGDKTQGGGGVKKTLGQSKMIGATVELNKRKDRITYVDKPTPVQQAVSSNSNSNGVS
jgi:hypothetical protein